MRDRLPRLQPSRPQPMTTSLPARRTIRLSIDRPPVPLNIASPTLAYIIARAREFDAALDQHSDPPDETIALPDLDAEYLPAPTGDDTPYDDLHTALSLLNDEQMATLVAILWIGRGDYGRDGWKEALQAATEILEERDGVDYLCGTPLVADYLSEGLDTLGHRMDDPGRLVL